MVNGLKEKCYEHENEVNFFKEYFCNFKRESFQKNLDDMSERYEQCVRENNLLRNKLNEFEDFENSKIENLNKENLEKELLLLKNLREVKIQNESLSSRITTLEQNLDESNNGLDKKKGQIESLEDMINELSQEKSDFEQAFEKLIEEKDPPFLN